MLSVFATLNPYVTGTILVCYQISPSGWLEVVVKQFTGLLAVGIGSMKLAKSGLEIGSECYDFAFLLYVNPFYHRARNKDRN